MSTTFHAVLELRHELDMQDLREVVKDLSGEVMFLTKQLMGTPTQFDPKKGRDLEPT